MSAAEKKDTLKSTAVVGGGQIFIIFSGIIKTKVAALLLGPAGVGVIGVLTMLTDLIKSIASLGLPLSGVRDIAKAEETADIQKIQSTSQVFIQWTFVTAIFGLLICFILGFPLSKLLFQNYSYGWGIMSLSIAVFFGSLSAGILSIFQGKRQIGLLVKSNVVSTVLGSLAAIILYMVFKDAAIIPSFIVSAIVSLSVNFYYFRNLRLPLYSKLTLRESFPHAKEMITVGIYIISVVVFDNLMGLFLRSFVSKKSGMVGLGQFTAANTVAGMYLTIVLSSLSSDYLPKLSALKTDVEVEKAVNLQLHIILLLAAPIIIAMAGYSDIVLKILYSSQFLGAQEILRWQIVGDFFKIISWPCGFILLARGFGKMYTWYSIGYTLLYIILIYLFWDVLGFQIIGLAFLFSQLVSMVFIYSWFWRRKRLRIDYVNYRLIFIFGVLLLLSFMVHFLPISLWIKYIIGGIFSAGAIFISFKNLQKDMPLLDVFLRRINLIKAKFKL